MKSIWTRQLHLSFAV